MNVFISYSSRDRREALAIKRLLEEHDCEVWLDAFDIVASENLRDQLLSNIARADLFCLLLSPTSIASNWVEKEIEEAFRPRTQPLKVLPIILRPCKIPERLQELPAFPVHEVASGYRGLEDEAVRLQLVRRVFGAATVSDIKLDEAMRKSLADQAEQLEAAGAMLQISRELERLRTIPFRDVHLLVDSAAFEGSIYDENPFVLELRLIFDVFTAPLQIFVAPFKEGHTWPAAFGFDEPPYSRFDPDQPRLDCKLRWYERVEDVRGLVDRTDLGSSMATFAIPFDGAQWQPQAGQPSRFGPSLPPPALNYEIPSLHDLIADDSRFHVILHRTKTETAEVVDPAQTDIAVRLICSLREHKTALTLFNMPYTELATVLLGGDYLSRIANPIERTAILGRYPNSTSVDSSGETRVRIHRLRLALQEIDWDGDRRLVARLIDINNLLFAARRQLLKILDWETVPGVGTELLREFLLYDWTDRSYFAHLVFDGRAQIEKAHIGKNTDGNIEIRAPGRAFLVTPFPQAYCAEVTATEGDFAGSTLHHFHLAQHESRLALFVDNRMDLVFGWGTILDLLGPIVFERVPSFADGSLFVGAAAQLFGHYSSNEMWSDAHNMAINCVNASRKLALRDPNEDTYKRWEALALERLGTAELKLTNVDGAVAAFTASLRLFRDLYQGVPNGVRMADLLRALDNMTDRSVKNNLPMDTVSLKAELSSLQRERQKVLAFADSIGAEHEGERVDILSQMADQLEISGSITAKPRGELSDVTFEAFHRVLERAGFAWTLMLGENGFEGSWEKWGPEESEDTHDGEHGESHAPQS